MKLGADRFIEKPIELAEFIKEIEDMKIDAMEGKIKRAEPVPEDEKEISKMYSERVANKLEQKMLDLVESELEMRKINRTFETLSRGN